MVQLSGKPFFLLNGVNRKRSFPSNCDITLYAFLYLQERKVPTAEMAWPSSEIVEMDVEIVSYNTRLMAKIFSLLKN